MVRAGQLSSRQSIASKQASNKSTTRLLSSVPLGDYDGGLLGQDIVDVRFKQRELFEYRAADTSSCRALGDALRADILGYEPTSTINVG